MNYFKKNKLISLIIIAMLIGLFIGYAVNFSLTKNKFLYDKSTLSSISNPEIKKQVEKAIVKYEEKCFKESKKNIASKLKEFMLK
jgi:uncharacterized membrane protein